MSTQAKPKGSPVTAATVESLFGIKPPALTVVAGSKEWGAREWALHYAAKGFSVFPLQGDQKVPFTAESHPGHSLRGGQRRATRKREVIERWFSQFPDIGYGLLMDGHTGVDVDTHKDGPWEFELSYLFSFMGMPTTLTHRSASGGLHCIFKGESRSRRWHYSLAQEEALIDVKSGPTAYLVGPGSRYAGGTYALMHDAPIADLPDYVRQRIGVAVDTGESVSAKWVCESDLPFNVTAAIDQLKAQPPAVEGEYGDQHTFNVARAVMDWGLSEEKCLELMLTHFNDRCTPPWDDEALERKIRNAAQYRARPFGCRQAPQYEFEPIGAEPGASDERKPDTSTWPDADWSLLETRRGELPAFPLDLLPTQWRAWAERASDGAGVTPAFVVVPAIAIVSSLIGTARRVQASASWSEPFTNWTGVVGYSGSGKTPGLGASLRSLAEIERQRNKKLGERRRDHDTKVFIAEIAKKEWAKELGMAIKMGQPIPEKPEEAEELERFVTPRLFVNDTTIERLAQLVAARPSGLLMINDELTALFANMSRFTGGSDRPFWLEAWNGKNYVVERVGRAPVVVDYLLIGLTGGFQPDLMATAFRGDNDGFYARFLFSWPEEAAFKELTDDVREIDPGFHAAIKRLAELRGTEGDKVVPEYVPLSEDARTVFEEFRRRIHDGKAPLEGREREVWSKFPAHALRLGGTLAMAEWAFRGGDEPNEEGAAFMRAATKLLIEYFWPHARAAMRQIGLSDRHADARRVLRWLRTEKKDSLSVEDVRVLIFGKRIDAKQSEELLQVLEKACWLRKLPDAKTGGRPLRRWAVNPALFKQDGSSGGAAR